MNICGDDVRTDYELRLVLALMGSDAAGFSEVIHKTQNTRLLMIDGHCYNEGTLGFITDGFQKKDQAG
uniref:Uncharacterized protein n=1 Tax=Panagrolaimus superbus TaxID=310955 RepID=A0A914ZD33_9BILA